MAAGAQRLRTVCRVCESACGLIATVQGDRVQHLAPDPEHPVSGGLACAKGLHFHGFHHGPDRVRSPWLRGEGDVSWERALASVGRRLAAIVDSCGPAAVGVYSGNAAGHSLGGVLAVAALVNGFATPKHYSCLTLDNAPMYPVLEACVGHALRTFVADYEHSDCILLVGTDPLSSQPSQAQSHPRGVTALLARRAELTVVDPRRSATARRAAYHLAPRPGTDVLVLAWLLSRALEARPGPQSLRQAVAGVSDSDLVRAGLEVSMVAALAERLLQARKPLVWSGLGVLLGGHGTVGYWLTLALQATLVGLDTPGGWRLSRGRVDLPRVASWLGVRGRDPSHRSRVGDYSAVLGTVAAATLADDVLTDGPDRMRALVVVGGNPAVALPSTHRAQQALSRLDLLVCIDLVVNETGARSHAVLPAASWLARDEVAVHSHTQRPVPHIDDVSAVVPPVGLARPDLQIATDLVRAAGRVPFGSRAVAHVVRATGAASLGRWALRLGPRPDARAVQVQLDVPWLLDALGTALAELRAADPTAVRLLTSVRPARTMNSWLRTGRVGPPQLGLHPRDFERVGDTVRVTGPGGEAMVTAVADHGVRLGTAVWPFGWSESNPNQVVGTDALEAITGQPVSNGTPVTLSHATRSAGEEPR